MKYSEISGSNKPIIMYEFSGIFLRIVEHLRITIPSPISGNFFKGSKVKRKFEYTFDVFYGSFKNMTKKLFTLILMKNNNCFGVLTRLQHKNASSDSVKFVLVNKCF